MRVRARAGVDGKTWFLFSGSSTLTTLSNYIQMTKQVVTQDNDSSVPREEGDGGMNMQRGCCAVG